MRVLHVLQNRVQIELKSLDLATEATVIEAGVLFQEKIKIKNLDCYTIVSELNIPRKKKELNIIAR